jgi:hypothetical protein
MLLHNHNYHPHSHQYFQYLQGDKFHSDKNIEHDQFRQI